MCFFFSSRRRHTRYWRDWSSDVCSSDLLGQRRELGWALHRDQIEDAAERAGEGVLAPGFLAPFGARTLAGCAAHGHAVLAHEGGKQRPRLLAPVLALALERAVDLGGDGETHLAAEHDGVLAGEGVQAGDAGAEAARDQQRRLEQRCGGARAYDGPQGLHGDPRLPVKCMFRTDHTTPRTQPEAVESSGGVSV